MSEHITGENWQKVMQEDPAHMKEYWRVSDQTNEEWLEEYSKPKEQV